MTANVMIAAVAALAAGYLTRSYHGTPAMLRKTVTTLALIGLAAFGIAWIIAEGSC